MTFDFLQNILNHNHSLTLSPLPLWPWNSFATEAAVDDSPSLSSIRCLTLSLPLATSGPACVGFLLTRGKDKQSLRPPLVIIIMRSWTSSPSFSLSRSLIRDWQQRSAQEEGRRKVGPTLCHRFALDRTTVSIFPSLLACLANRRDERERERSRGREGDRFSRARLAAEQLVWAIDSRFCLITRTSSPSVHSLSRLLLLSLSLSLSLSLFRRANSSFPLLRRKRRRAREKLRKQGKQESCKSFPFILRLRGRDFRLLFSRWHFVVSRDSSRGLRRRRQGRFDSCRCCC